MKKRQPFVEILAEVRSEQSIKPHVRPGRYNRAGDLFDPSGNRLSRVGELTAARAAELVRDGAQLAWESCGCGGWSGCLPEWIDEPARESLGDGRPPQTRHKRHAAPTWIDLWQGQGGATQVVYAHGNVVWGDALA